MDRKNLIEKICQRLPDGSSFYLLYETDRVIPSLCAGYADGSPLTPNRKIDVDEQLKNFEPLGQEPLVSGHYKLFLDEKLQPEIRENISELGFLLNTFLFQSLSYYNSIQDEVTRELEKFRFTESGDRPVNQKALLKMLEKHFGIEACYVRLLHGSLNTDVPGKLSPSTTQNLDTLTPRAEEALKRGRVINITGEIIENLEEITGVLCPTPPGKTLYLFPVRSLDPEVINTNELILAAPKNRTTIPVSTVFAIDQCVQAYIHIRTKKGQQQSLFNQTKYLTNMIEHLSLDQNRDDELFRSFIEDLGRTTLQSTQAHSFAYLSYDAARGCLRREVCLGVDEKGQVVPRSEGLADVSLKESNRLLSAYLFENSADLRENYIYIKNIKSPSSWEDLGMENIHCTRNSLIKRKMLTGDNTVSEAAFLIEDQGLPIGVICVESPYPNGFDADESFLQQLTYNASNCWSLLYRLSDQLWLRRNLKLQDVSHDLKKLIDALPESEIRVRLDEVLNERENPPYDKTEPAGPFDEAVNDMINTEAAGAEWLCEELFRLVRVYTEPDHAVPAELQGAALTIVRDLLRNRKHTKTPQPIRLTSRDTWHGVSPALVIRTKLPMRCPQNEILDAFRRPISRPDREHVGLYMIGVIVRSFGGRLSFDRRPEQEMRELEICFPITKVHE